MYKKMKYSMLYYSNNQMRTSYTANEEIIAFPKEISNRIHYLSKHIKKIYSAEKVEVYRKSVVEFEKLAKYYSCDIYIDDESFPNIGIIRLVSNNILLHDEYTCEAAVDLLSNVKEADEVTIESYNYNNCENLVSLTIKYYLFDLIM